jgi:hypothetical protein
MAITTITRTTWTDDDGSGTTGTILNNAQLQAIFDAIDQLFSGSGSYATVEFGGGLKVDGVADLAGYKETKTDITVSSNTIAINMALGSLFNFQATAAINTTTITNVPASGRFASFVARVKGDGTARTWTWFDSTVKWGGGVAPTRTSTNNKFDWFMFTTVDGGTTWTGAVMVVNSDN